MSKNLLRVKKSAPCPICDKPDWCRVSPDGLTALCSRISEGSALLTKDGANVFRWCQVCGRWGACGVSKSGDVTFCQNVPTEQIARTGAYVHRIAQPRLSPKNSLTPNCGPRTASLAPIEKRNCVFLGLLEGLTLEGKHADDLAHRGLPDAEVTRQLYSSSPDQRAAQALTDDLVTRFGDLHGVPGFYRSGGRWHLVSLDSGLLIPVRDHEWRIQALRLRRDCSEKARYIWVSSSRYSDGVSSGAPMHWARPWRIGTTRRLIVTEGELKAEVAAEFLDEAVLSLPGVSTFTSTIGEDLRRLFPMLEGISIAYDADWCLNKSVLEALLRLGQSLRRSGLAVSKMEWPESVAGVRAKGIDDYLSRTYQNG